MTEVRLSFKEMCAKFEVTPRTLRYYEYIELLQPDREGRSRFYGPREVARMTLILRGRRFGFSLEEIRQWLGLYGKAGTRAQSEALIAMANRQLAALDRQRLDLNSAITELAALRDKALADLAPDRRRYPCLRAVTRRFVYLYVNFCLYALHQRHSFGPAAAFLCANAGIDRDVRHQNQ